MRSITISVIFTAIPCPFKLFSLVLDIKTSKHLCNATYKETLDSQCIILDNGCMDVPDTDTVKGETIFPRADKKHPRKDSISFYTERKIAK